MADCNEVFRAYNNNIKLFDDKRQKLIQIRDGLREKIKHNYKTYVSSDVRDQNKLRFYTQGSIVMDTIINPIEGDFDLDDGVYFMGNLDKTVRQKPETYHKFVIQAITEGKEENEHYQVKDKNTCVRVIVKNEGLHIDLPIYYATSVKTPELAHKSEGWIVSNPIEFIDWFETKVASGFKLDYLYEHKLMHDDYIKWLSDIRKNDHQLRRIIRYLKGWGDFTKGEMPPGIVMTILGAENYQMNSRDDVSLKDTLIQIREYLTKNGFKCPRPTTPIGQDLFENYTRQQKEFFKNELDKFIASAVQAVNIDSGKDSCTKWQRHFGDRFPCDTFFKKEEHVKFYPSKDIIKHDNKSA